MCTNKPQIGRMVKLLTASEISEMKVLGNLKRLTPEQEARWNQLNSQRIVLPADELIARGLARRRVTMLRETKSRRRWYAEVVVENDARYRAEDGSNVIYDPKHFRERLHEIAAEALRSKPVRLSACV